MHARERVKMCRGGGGGGDPSIVNEVLPNDRSRSFFCYVLQKNFHCLPVHVDIRALHFSSIH